MTCYAEPGERRPLRRAETPRVRQIEPEDLLAAAVLQRAALDWKVVARMPEKYRKELRRFFDSEMFLACCDLLGLAPDYVHRRMTKSSR